MAERQRGMGRGLSAILSVTPREEPEELRQLPVELIVPNPHQPRRRFDADALTGLVESVRVRGILQPVLVRPVAGGTYELIAGERRWRAAKLAELETVPAIIRHHDDAASLEVALIENMVRQDLNPIEEARACAALTEELGLTREEVGIRVGRSRVAVSNLIRLLDLPDTTMTAVEERTLSEGHGRALLLAADHDDRRRLTRTAIELGWSVRQLEDHARRANGGADRASRPRRTRPPLHPDQEAAVTTISDRLGSVLGQDVEVTVTADGGYRVHLSFGSAEAALELAARLQP